MVDIMNLFKDLRREFQKAIKSVTCDDELKEQSYLNGYECGRIAPANIKPEQLTRAGIISVLNNEYKATSEKLDWCSFGLGFVNGVLATVNNLQGGQHDF